MNIALIITLLVLILPFPITFFVIYKINVIDRKEKIKKYTTEVPGTIIKLKHGGLDRPDVITVEYEVDNIKYKVTETIKLKSKAIKIGFLPIRQIKEPFLKSISEGTQVIVLHHPANPAQAIIKGNDGLFNV